MNGCSVTKEVLKMAYAAEVIRSGKANRTTTAKCFNAWKDWKWKPIDTYYFNPWKLTAVSFADHGAYGRLMGSNHQGGDIVLVNNDIAIGDDVFDIGVANLVMMLGSSKGKW
jgi:hypothetical protein